VHRPPRQRLEDEDVEGALEDGKSIGHALYPECRWRESGGAG
jgi:hypothetical protein